jgi:serine phosphatase RsbU (regulator of sigma subunit)
MAVRYKFRLKGYDKSWSEATPINTIVYNTIMDGDYEFEVIACNEFGIWNNKPATVKITINKPWTKEWWFYSLLIAGILILLYLFIAYRTKRLLKEKQNLEGLVKERTLELEKRNQQILENRDEIEEKAKHITDSIKYAKRIQKAIYPTTSHIKRLLPDSFIFFKSKGIVSGDFYWIEEVGSKVLFAACDCTGHGVPGAFISIVTNNLLNQAVKEHGLSKPSLILDEVNRGVTQALHQTLEDSVVKDGMDAALCAFDRQTGKLEYAGAYNSMFLVRGGELTEIKADSIAIGRFIGEAYRTFTNHEIEVQTNDVIYLFSDGFADQFGGPDGKKIKKNNFKTLLIQLSPLPMEEQREKLYNYFKSWQGEVEQVDDVLVIGVRIKK